MYVVSSCQPWNSGRGSRSRRFSFFFSFFVFLMLFILLLLTFTKIISLFFYLFIYFFHENYFYFFMFRDFLGCSGMFRVPGFIDALSNVIVVLLIKPTAFWRSTFSLHQTVHGNDWLCTEPVYVWLFLALWLSVIRALQASFTVGWLSKSQLLRPRPNVEPFMRRTKLSELRLWKVWRLPQLSSSEWVWIVQHVLSVCFRRIKKRLKIVSGTHVDLHIQRTKLINWKFVWWCIFSLVREKTYYWSDSVDWFDESWVRRLTQQTILT